MAAYAHYPALAQRTVPIRGGARRFDIALGQCINRELLPEHIARMALFLASDDSSMCTAQDFVVDAGWV